MLGHCIARCACSEWICSVFGRWGRCGYCNTVPEYVGPDDGRPDAHRPLSGKEVVARGAIVD